MGKITINTTFDAVYTGSGKDWPEARENAIADSINNRSSSYSASVYGNVSINRIYMEFDLSSVLVPITKIDLYIYVNSTDGGKLSVVYCGQTNLSQDESDFRLYINNSGSRLSNLDTKTGLSVLALDLNKGFSYDPKNGTSIVFALITNNDFDNISTNSRSINIDSSLGINIPYIIINDTNVQTWNSSIKGISYSNISSISGVNINIVSGLNGVFNR